MSWGLFPLIAIIAMNVVLMPMFLFLFATTLAAIFAPPYRPSRREPRSRFLVLIPAHDEESGIANTVRSCLAANYPEGLFGVVVIADNCADSTAAVAASAGARVVERFDAAKKSKGYAIEFLIESLIDSGEFDALDALVVIDADTTIDPDLLREFDRALGAGRDWVQCYYTVANPDSSWRTRLMTYAFSLFNGVMLLGQNRLGASAGFRGNGMCFSTRGLRRQPWACYGLVEDMEYSWTLRVSGEHIAFWPEATVHGAMLGSGGNAAANQRNRWEFGRREIRRKYLPAVIRSKDLGLWEKAASACELCLPSMASLLVAYAMTAGLDLVVFAAKRPDWFASERWTLLACGLFMTVALGFYAISPFLAMRLPWRYLPNLAFVPFYMIWKLLVTLRGRPKKWVRTAREAEVGEVR